MMKKFLIINLLFLLLLTSVTYSIQAATITEDSLSNTINKFNTILQTKIDTDNPNYLTEILDENNNVPAYKYYPNHIASRSIKTLKEYDGKIFMGLGDWNDNTGPAKILYYDTTDGKIKTSGTINDEAVQNFSIIDDKIYTTGCDPRHNWGYGSYYIYNKEENKWDEHKKNNGWIHVFDIVEFKDKLFMCGSTMDTTSTSTIQVSLDEGKTFQSIPVKRNNKFLPYDSNLRCYRLMVYNNKLYAYIKYSIYDGIYEYDETKNEFNFISNQPYLQSSTYGVYSLASYNYTYFNYEVFNDVFLYVSGVSLYKSNDLKKFTKIVTNTNDVIQDVVVSDDTLYTLSYAYNSSNKNYTTRIYKTKDLDNFELVYEFIADTPPLSIEHHNNNFYIGTGTAYGSASYKDSSKIGSLYRIDLNNIKKSMKLDTVNKQIEITENNNTYSVDYDLSGEKSTFKLELNFDNTMTKKQWDTEYYKLKNLDLIYATIADNSNIGIDEAIKYFNNVLSKNLPTTTKTYSSATQYSQEIFAKELNIKDYLFTLTTKKISTTDDEYKTQVTLTINNIPENSANEPSTDNTTTNNNSNNSNSIVGNYISSSNNSESSVNEYINNNSKLPQTGRFFELKNLLQIFIIVSIIFIVILIIKDIKSKNDKN